MFRVDNRLLFLKENNNKISKMQSHKMQTAVASVRAKTKYVLTLKEQVCNDCYSRGLFHSRPMTRNICLDGSKL